MAQPPVHPPANHSEMHRLIDDLVSAAVSRLKGNSLFNV